MRIAQRISVTAPAQSIAPPAVLFDNRSVVSGCHAGGLGRSAKRTHSHDAPRPICVRLQRRAYSSLCRVVVSFGEVLPAAQNEPFALSSRAPLRTAYSLPLKALPLRASCLVPQLVASDACFCKRTHLFSLLASCSSLRRFPFVPAACFCKRTHFVLPIVASWLRRPSFPSCLRPVSANNPFAAHLAYGLQLQRIAPACHPRLPAGASAGPAARGPSGGLVSEFGDTII